MISAHFGGLFNGGYMELNDLDSKSLSDLACMIELAYVKNYSNEDIKAIKDAFLETCKIELSSALSDDSDMGYHDKEYLFDLCSGWSNVIDDDETVCELIREAIEQVLEAELG